MEATKTETGFAQTWGNAQEREVTFMGEGGRVEMQDNKETRKNMPRNKGEIDTLGKLG